MANGNTDYPHDGVIGWNDPFWQSLERDQTNEDQARMTMTSAEYEAYLAECERQEGIDHSPQWVPSTAPIQEWENGVLYTLIEGEWVAEGAQPIGAGDAYYQDEVPAEMPDTWALAVEQAERGNYLDPLIGS